MTDKRTRAAATDDTPTEPPPAEPDSRITLSREEIEAYREKLRTRYHEP